MKIIILKRLDSSLEAFKRTINSMTILHEVFLEMLNNGLIPIGKGSNTELRESLKYEGDFIEDVKQLEDLAKKIREGQAETGNLYKPEAFRIEEWKNDIIDDIADYKKLRKTKYILYDQENHLHNWIRDWRRNFSSRISKV